MKNHEYFAELISRRLDGDLTAAEQTELYAHLAECDECRKLAEDMLALSAAFEQTLVEPPETLRASVMRSVKISRARKKRLIPGIEGVAAASVAVVLLINGGYFFDSTMSAETLGVYGDARSAVPQQADGIVYNAMTTVEESRDFDSLDDYDESVPETAADEPGDAAIADAPVEGAADDVTLAAEKNSSEQRTMSNDIAAVAVNLSPTPAPTPTPAPITVSEQPQSAAAAGGTNIAAEEETVPEQQAAQTDTDEQKQNLAFAMMASFKLDDSIDYDDDMDDIDSENEIADEEELVDESYEAPEANSAPLSNTLGVVNSLFAVGRDDISALVYGDRRTPSEDGEVEAIFDRIYSLELSEVEGEFDETLAADGVNCSVEFSDGTAGGFYYSPSGYLNCEGIWYSFENGEMTDHSETANIVTADGPDEQHSEPAETDSAVDTENEQQPETDE